VINWRVRPLRPDSHKRVSGMPGALQMATITKLRLGSSQPRSLIDSVLYGYAVVLLGVCREPDNSQITPIARMANWIPALCAVG